MVSKTSHYQAMSMNFRKFKWRRKRHFGIPKWYDWMLFEWNTNMFSTSLYFLSVKFIKGKIFSCIALHMKSNLWKLHKNQSNKYTPILWCLKWEYIYLCMRDKLSWINRSIAIIIVFIKYFSFWNLFKHIFLEYT